MRLSVPGRLAWAVAAAAALVGAAIAAVHTRPAARWSRDWVVRQVAERWQLDLTAGRLDLNLFTRRVSVDDVRLAVPGHADAPFFTARHVSVTLPWSIVRGQVRLAPLEVEGARVLLVRERGVLVNLPPPSGQPVSDTARRLDVRGLQVRGLDVDYHDRTGDIDVSVRDLRAALTERDIRIFAGASGTLAAASITARVAGHATTSGAVQGRVAFDGSNVSLQQLTAPFPEGTIVADGRINRVLDDVRFALTLAGTLDLATVAAWTPPPVPISGAGTFDGTLEGPLGGYELRAAFGSSAMTIARVPGLTLAGGLTLTSPRAVIEPLTITTPPQGGTARRGVFDGRFAYEFGDTGALDLGGAFRDLDLDTALALYDQAPLTVAAWQQGTVSLRRETPQSPMRLRATGQSAPLARADRVALGGTWDASLADDRWVVRHDHRLLDSARAYGTAQWNAGGDLARTAIAGPVTLEIADVGAAIRAARRSGIGMSASLVDLKGTAHGALALGGTLDRTRVTGRVESRDLVLPTGARATAGADLVYDEDSLSAPAFALDTAGAHVTGHVRMGMVSSRLDGAFEAAISLPEFLVPLRAAGAAVPPIIGGLTLAGSIGGTTDVPDVPLQVQSTPMRYETQPLGTLTGAARLLGTDLRVDRLVLDQGPGQLNVAGHVDYETYAYDAAVSGKGLTWTRPVPGTEVEAVTVDVSYDGSGTLDAPGGHGSLTVAPTGGLGEFTGTADVRWQFANGSAAITAFWPKLRAWAQADVEPRAPYAFRGIAVVNQLDVQPLALTAGALVDAVSGTVDFSSTFSGALSDVAASTAFVNLQAVDLSVGGLPVRLDRPARITARLGDYTVDDLAMSAGASRLALGGRFREGLDEPLRAAFTGDVADVTALARAFAVVPGGTMASGAVRADWESRGSLATARSTITVENGTITVDGVPPLDGLAATATFDGATIRVDSLSAQWQGGRIDATASVPRALFETTTGSAPVPPGRVDMRLTGLTERALAPWLPAASLASMSGRVSATLGLNLSSATLSGAQGTLVLDEATVTASGVPIAQSRPSYMSIAGGVLTFDDVEFSAGVPVMIGGSVSFAGATDLDVWITGTPGLRPLSVLSPAMSVDGVATLDLRVTGSPAAPRLVGRVELDDAEIVMRDPRVIASDITGPILFEGDRISIPRLTGSLNGGSLEASGALTMTGFAVGGGDVTFQARGVAVEYPRNVDSEIDALLVFSPGPSTPLLRGDVRVLRSSYRATISVPALVAFNALSAVAAAEPSYLDGVRLDVSLSTDDDMIVDNNYGRFEAGANVRLQGTAARPGVTGRAELREGGEIFLLGGVYRLNASSIAFTDPSAIAPDMNISMFEGEVTVSLSGTLDRLQTNVTSTDPNANTNLLNVLLGGDTTLTGARAVELFSGELLGVTGRALGLDALRIERGVDANVVRQDPGLVAGELENPATRLTLSKQLRSNIEVILSRELAGSGSLSAVVSYRPWRGVELRGTTRDNTDRTYAVRHELSFGGPVAAVAPPPRPITYVSDVKIVGAVPDDERRLREVLRVVSGARFDFIRWREDGERLQSWYHAQGFLEARVRTSRAADPADGRTLLVYTVSRGPRTDLRVVGTAATARLQRALERAWSDGVFDGFRVDEMQRVVALDLVRRDVVGAQVEATVSQPAEGQKRIDVAVTGGTRVSARDVVIRGAESVPARELESALRARGLADYVWVDPASAIEPLKARYAESGFRAVTVTAEVPRIEAGRAVLTVSVTEGPLTTVLPVLLAGVSDERAGEVTAIVRPLEGKPFRTAQVDEVRRRIEALYRARGFNDVAVSPAVVFQDGHLAELSLTVEPGREQRLHEVVVDGAGRTRPSAVVNAVHLGTGEPVDLARWAQARKRVFDTNIFRQVDVRPEVLPDVVRADGAQAVRARVSVTEWPAWRLRYGLQFNDTNQANQGGDTSVGRARGLGVVADLQNRNAFGRAFTFGLFGRAERRLQSSNAYVAFPTLFGRAVRTNVFASVVRAERFFDEQGNPLILQNRSSLSLEQRVRRGRALEIVYGYRVTRDEQDGTDPADPFYLAPVTGRFTGSAFFDRRNDPFNASRGWFASLTAERVSEFVSNADSIKVLGTFYRYQPLGPVTLASAVRVGGSFLGSLAFIDPFFVGGSDTVRGYGDDSLGATNFLGDAQGGNALLVLNQEVRTPIYRWLKGVLFVDAGNVFASNSDVSLSGSKVGYGAGLRLDTPYSLLRFDVARPAQGGGKLRWYLGLGHIF